MSCISTCWLVVSFGNSTVKQSESILWWFSKESSAIKTPPLLQYNRKGKYLNRTEVQNMLHSIPELQKKWHLWVKCVGSKIVLL